MDDKIHLNELATDAQKQRAEGAEGKTPKVEAGNWTPDFETSGNCGGKGGGGDGATIAVVPNF